MSDPQHRDRDRAWRKGTAAAGLAVIAALIVAPAAPAAAIARGQNAPVGKYPFAVKIIDNGIPTADGGTRDSACSGGLISPSWILTAGHCFRDVNGKHVSRTVAEETIAVINRADLTTDEGHELNIVAVKQNKKADVALAKLEEPVFDVAPMVLTRKAPKVGSTVRLTGYGFTSRNAKKLPQRMQTGTFEVTSVGDIEIGMEGKAPHANTSACEHDSGGPYFTEAADGTVTVVGVVSHGPSCPHTGADAAGRIDNILPWIKSVVGKDLNRPSPSPSPSPSASARASTVAAPAPTTAGFTVPKAAWVAVPVGGVAVIGAAVAAATRRSRRREDAFRHRR
ncbi:S1 family peptidase [Actinoplanes sp. RD1]|uniref:S1 family peptidase n=1 Tax=Actinoplanes sp. RD1 TaxID=3064538 RepID=UPI0027410D51|nr:trypsin-like serine protease [Actinoplanes sp. RD1]